MRTSRAAFVLALAYTASTSLAWAVTYQVGPGKDYATIQETLDLLKPGDVVEVQGNHTYPGDLWFREGQEGTAAAPVTIRGIPIDGKRPVIQGIGTEEWHDMIVFLNANHFVFEGFEIIGDGDPNHSGIINKADDVTIRNVVVHDVAGQGLMGTDEESGSLKLLDSEFYRNGNGLQNHQIYMATDETMYPGSVFHMQGCYVHDGTGGNNVKSRAERNEIYYNWIENAVYHELDLIGPDGQDPDLAQENSDVVGNVLVKSSEYRIARIGGDGTGNTAGRYRFVNNTMLLAESTLAAIGLQETVEVVEMYNNVIVQPNGGNAQLQRHDDPSGPDAVFFGSNNFIQAGITDIPSSFTGTLGATDAGFTNEAGFDLRPREASPLIDAGTSTTDRGIPAFPNPLPLPSSVPPARILASAAPRASDGKIDIGAYEFGSGAAPGPGGPSSNTAAAPKSESGCSCSLHSSSSSRAPGVVVLLLGLALGVFRKKR